MPLPTLPAPVCITTADPFPIADLAHPSGATSEAVRALPDEGEFFDTARILAELRPPNHAGAVPGPGGVAGGAALLSFAVYAPAGAPMETPRGVSIQPVGQPPRNTGSAPVAADRATAAAHAARTQQQQQAARQVAADAAIAGSQTGQRMHKPGHV